MNADDKRALFKALRSIDRLDEQKKSGTKEPQSSEMREFIDRAWQALIHPQKLKTAATKLHRHIASSVIDEGEADEAQMMSNYYFYAVSDLAKYFAEEDASYLESPKEWEIEQARFAATQKVLGNMEGAGILTPEQIQQIESSDLVIGVFQAQQKDEKLADEIADWSRQSVDELRRGT